VELVGACSDQSRTAAKFADLRRRINDSPARRSGRRDRGQGVPRRLNVEETSDLVQGYRAGLTVYELASQFGIHRGMVSGVLEREEVQRRRRPLSTSQVEEPSVLYENGWSLARVGEELGCDASTVWRALAKLGKTGPYE